MPIRSVNTASLVPFALLVSTLRTHRPAHSCISTLCVSTARRRVNLDTTSPCSAVILMTFSAQSAEHVVMACIYSNLVVPTLT